MDTHAVLAQTASSSTTCWSCKDGRLTALLWWDSHQQKCVWHLSKLAEQAIHEDACVAASRRLRMQGTCMWWESVVKGESEETGFCQKGGETPAPQRRLGQLREPITENHKPSVRLPARCSCMYWWCADVRYFQAGKSLCNPKCRPHIQHREVHIQSRISEIPRGQGRNSARWKLGSFCLQIVHAHVPAECSEAFGCN